MVALADQAAGQGQFDVVGHAMAVEDRRLLELAPDADLDDLPFWDLAAALRPAAAIADWAGGWTAAGRPDITEEVMRARHRAFRAAALDRLAVS